jgi:hypothetical protein
MSSAVGKLMHAIGVCFEVVDENQFKSLQTLFREIKLDKQADKFRNPNDWIALVPGPVRGNFNWPTAQERAHLLSIRDSVLIAVHSPSQQVGAMWNFYSVFEAIESAEYDLIECEMTEATTAEMRINPWAYPYMAVSVHSSHSLKLMGLRC